jgi:hypothetical protein
MGKKAKKQIITRVIRDLRKGSQKDMPEKDFKSWTVSFMRSLRGLQSLSDKDRLNIVNVALNESIL